MAGVVLPAGTITDNVADTIDDELGNVLSAAKADIVGATAEYRPEGITLGVRVRQPQDPAKDTNWFSDATFVWWELDTTGDDKPDYEPQFYADSDSGDLTGLVIRPGDAEEVPPVCDASSTRFSTDAGYTMVIPPKCVGNPASFRYRAHIHYDTTRGDDNAPVATDVVPDQGWTSPITNGTAPTPAPAPAAAPPAPAKPNPAPAKPNPAPAAAPRGPETAPAPPAAPGKPNPAPAAKPAPAPAKPAPASAKPTPAPVAPGASDPAPSAPLPADLARTGSGALRLAGFGAAVAFAGLSLVLSGGRRRLVPAPVEVGPIAR
jgi:hypothetical protein